MEFPSQNQFIIMIETSRPADSQEQINVVLKELGNQGLLAINVTHNSVVEIEQGVTVTKYSHMITVQRPPQINMDDFLVKVENAKQEPVAQ